MLEISIRWRELSHTSVPLIHPTLKNRAPTCLWPIQLK